MSMASKQTKTMGRPPKTKVFWKPHPGPQTDVLKRTEYEILFGGARGGGKSEAGRAWLSRWAHVPGLRALVIRRHADDLRDWFDKARLFYKACGAEIVGNPGEIRFPAGGKIITGHFKDENSYTKYQGQEFQKIVVEELNHIPTKQRYQMLISSCRSTVPELKPQVLCTANPGGPGHLWVREHWNISGAPRQMIRTIDEISGRARVFIPSRLSDNPTLMKSDPTYVNFLQSLPEALRKAWLDGDWDVFAGQFFGEWGQRHICDPFPIPSTWKRIRTIDHGRTNPTACLWGAIDYDGRIWWYREHYMAGVDADVNAAKIAYLSEGEKYAFTVLDSSCFSKTGHGESIAEIYQRNGVPDVMPSPKDRIAGWNLFHEYLRDDPPKMTFFSTCTNSIRTIPTLIHDERKPEDLDTDGDDHVADAVSYTLQTLHEGFTEKPKDPLQVRLEQFAKGRRNNNSRHRFYPR